MKILITGAAGFIGTYLSKELRIAGHDVVGVDRKDGDLIRPGVADWLVKSHRPDVLVHLAAKVGRLFGEEDSRMTVETNVVATIHVAQACAEHGVQLVYGSTSEAFGDNGKRSVDEREHGVLPHNLYGLSKRWGEEAARLYTRVRPSVKDSLQILRMSMPYGPGLPAGRGRAAVLTFLWQARQRECMTVHRGGRRCLCWIGDLTSGIRMIIEDGGQGVWTVGRDDNETLMLDVAETACSIAGIPSGLIQEVDPPQNQTVIKRLNVGRLKSLGWKPRVSLLEGMTRTYEMIKLYDKDGAPPEAWRELVKKGAYS